MLPGKAKAAFFDMSRYMLATITNDPADIAPNLIDYVNEFSANVRNTFDRYGFADQLAKLEENDLLHLVLQKRPRGSCGPSSRPRLFAGTTLVTL